jgi:hypothetical protein
MKLKLNSNSTQTQLDPTKFRKKWESPKMGTKKTKTKKQKKHGNKVKQTI